MLLALRDFIQRYRTVSTEQLTREFCIANDALEPILDIWVTKGLIRKTNANLACGSGCRACKPKKQSEYYEWC